MTRLWQLPRSLAISCAFFLTPFPLAFGQTTISSGPEWASDAPALTQEDLDQLLAPIALYPDSLLSQIFMAATYPIEVVEAERWTRQNENLSGDALARALEEKEWDPSVKSLVNFQQVLAMMSEQLDWTTKLGDAFLAQQQDVMNTVQRLRIKAQDAGNLESNAQQNIIVEAAPPPTTTTTTNTTTIIRIEPAQPEVIYVPTYETTVVYGSWWYPTPPIYYWRPPGYVARSAFYWGAGFARGAAWGYAWGGCNWRHGNIDIDIRRNHIYNNNINRSRYNNYGGAGNNWRHNPQHRRGADYRNRNTAQQYGGRSAADSARNRDAYRGRAESGRQQINSGAADRFKQSGQPGRAQTRDVQRPGDGGNRPNAGGDRRPSGGQSAQQRPTRPNNPQANRPQQNNPSANRPQQNNAGADRPKQPSQSNRGGAFDGANRGSSNVKQQSNRGQSSRSGNASRGGGGGGSRGGGASRGGGGARGGGGGARGGGGRR